MSFWRFVKDMIFGPRAFRRKRVSPDVSSQIAKMWGEKIDPALKSQQPSQLRQALITADKLLDTALKDLTSGENLGQRLKNVQDLLPWTKYDRLWKAHKVRNALVHDVSYEPTYFILEEALRDYKDGLETLGVDF